MKLKHGVISVICLSLVNMVLLSILLTGVSAASIPVKVAAAPTVSVSVQNPTLRCSVLEAGQYMDELILNDLLEISANLVPDSLVMLDRFTATAYTTTGTTATGTYTTPGRTLAVNPAMIPYGTHLWLYLEDGTFIGDFYAEDTGSNMMEHPYVVDIYFGENMRNECMEWGARRVIAYVEA